ncbi:hypothetical protein CYMTET_13044 [Cymbomonas tetramitiformis]|uniref:30S ribosomal protein S20, chloroplastic n=1 Tax=Cymbomonas tetramitiformis TaxID=36881 RepID=A0AAE0LBU9_9CHLO|nr:hypothetical protein CYMTET_13044 [Cymbomonas tetramitiformis]
MAALSLSMDCLSLKTSTKLPSFASSTRGQSLQVGRSASVAVSRVSLQVSAAQNSLKRQRVAEKARVFHKAKKSAIYTRSKKYFTEIDSLVKDQAESEDAFALAEKLLADVYGEIDKAVKTGTIHKNTGDRRKSRLGRYKTTALTTLGLYSP